MKKKAIIALPVIALIIIVSVVFIFVSKNKSHPISNIASYNYNSETKICGDKTFTRDGIVSIDEGGHLLTVTDYKTGNYMPLCNKPNCKHNDGTCNARATDKDVFAFTYIYNDSLYLFANVGQQDFKVIKADKDGSNRKTILESHGFIAQDSVCDTIKDNKVYFVLDTKDLSKIGDITEDLPNEKSIMCFDFSTQKLTTVYDLPRNYQVNIKNFTIINNDLIFEQQYLTGKMDLYNNNNTNETDENERSKLSHRVITKLNINTKEYKAIWDNNNYVTLRIVNNSIYFAEYKLKNNDFIYLDCIYRYDLETGKTEKVLTSPLIEKYFDETDIKVLSNEIIINDVKHKKVYIYDLKGNLKSTVKNTKCSIIGECDDMYLLTVDRPFSLNFRAFISKEEFASGNQNIKYVGKMDEDFKEQISGS